MSERIKKLKLYDLSGLKFIFYSQIASMILSVVGACTQKHLMVSVIVSILALAAAVVSIVGVFKIGRYGMHFKKCRRIIIAMFIMIFAMVVLFLVLLNRRQTALLSAAEFFLPAVVGIIAWILGTLFIYHLFYGCGEIAEKEEDDKFAARCRRGWKIYIGCFVVSVAALIAAWICAFTADNPMAAIAVFLAAAAVCAVVMLIKVLQILYLTFKKYDRKEIGAKGKPTGTKVLSTLDDTAEFPADLTGQD